ncbi:hypothetical protein V7S79_10945 [Aquirufa sp. ROCK-SH2]
MQISIFGGGWVGNPLAKNLARLGHTVNVSKSSFRTLETNENLSELDWKAEINQLPEYWEPMCDSEVHIWTIPPRRKVNSEEFYLGVIRDWIQQINPNKVKKIIFLSSTSVYQNNNSWVYEESEVDETSLMLQAEKIIASAPCNSIIFRWGGLMGEERYVAKYFSGKIMDGGECPVNYVHQKDVLAILERTVVDLDSGIYNVVAPEHPSKKEVGDADCERRNMPKAIWNPGVCSSFKLVSSEKLMQALGYSFLEPNPINF